MRNWLHAYAITEINRRLHAAETFGRLSRMWRSSKIGTVTKLRLFITALFGSNFVVAKHGH